MVLAFHGTGISGHALDGGNILWSFPWENGPRVNSAQPIKLDERSLLISNGYGNGAARLEFAESGGAWSVEKSWETNLLKLKFNDAVLYSGYVYGLDDGILTCLDVATGKRKWKGGRYGYGQLLLHEDTLLVLTEEGGRDAGRRIAHTIRGAAPDSGAGWNDVEPPGRREREAACAKQRNGGVLRRGAVTTLAASRPARSAKPQAMIAALQSLLRTRYRKW